MNTTPRCRCAYCKTPIIGEPQYGIHRDDFGEGPEVDLCSGCGANPTPTCEQIWSVISHTRGEARA